MTRNMTLTGLLMLASVAAAVAAPELPADLAGCSSVKMMQPADSALAPAARVRADQPAARVIPVKATGAQSVQPQPGACDMTEPYRLLHHGSMKLAPACVAGAAI